MRWLIPAALTIAAAAYLARRSSSSPAFTLPDGWDPLAASSDAGSSDASSWPGWGGFAPSEPDQTTSLVEDLFVTLNPTTYLPANVSADTAAANVRAFLDTIAYSEDTAGYGDNGYNVLFGHGLFDSYADHPRQVFSFTNRAGETLKTSAAGRYQFLARTWDGLKAKLGLQDFSPASQDAGAIELIRERGALRDVQAGRFATAVDKVRTVWASLPGAGYNQGERSFSSLLAAYQRAGGTTESQA